MLTYAADVLGLEGSATILRAFQLREVSRGYRSGGQGIVRRESVGLYNFCKYSVGLKSDICERAHSVCRRTLLAYELSVLCFIDPGEITVRTCGRLVRVLLRALDTEWRPLFFF